MMTALLDGIMTKFYAQNHLLTQFTFKLLTNAGHETLLISEFKDFVLNNN